MTNMNQYQTVADSDTVMRDGTIKLHGPGAFAGASYVWGAAGLDRLVPGDRPLIRWANRRMALISLRPRSGLSSVRFLLW